MTPTAPATASPDRVADRTATATRSPPDAAPASAGDSVGRAGPARLRAERAVAGRAIVVRFRVSEPASVTVTLRKRRTLKTARVESAPAATPSASASDR